MPELPAQLTDQGGTNMMVAEFCDNKPTDRAGPGSGFAGFNAAALAHPLDEFYQRNGARLPPMDRIDGMDIPEPYRSLLVHDNDMTSTLESYYGQPPVLGVLGRRRAGPEYFREVVLLLAGPAQPVEFGAIKFYLNRFPAPVRQQILEEYWPLGRILKEHDIYFTSRPRAFLRMASDKLINGILRLQGVRMLYGRGNTICDPAGRLLAEIVEILPPIELPDAIRSS